MTTFTQDELSLAAALIKVVRRRAVRRRCYAKHRDEYLAKSKARNARRQDELLAQKRARRAAKRDFLLAIRRAEHARDKEHINELKRAWYAANPEKARTHTHKSYRKQMATKPEHLRELARKRNAKHPEKNRARASKWAQDNPDKMRANNHKRRARIKGSGGSFTAQEWKTLKRQYGHRCVGCWKTEKELSVLGRKLVPDHIIPVTKGGLNHITNIQPLCHGRGGCNNKKSAKYIDFVIS